MEKQCARCGVSYVFSGDKAPGHLQSPIPLDQYEKTFVKLYYKDNLCPECMQYVKDSFYAFDISPEYRKNK